MKKEIEKKLNNNCQKSAKREMFKCSNIHWGHFSTPRYARTLLYKGKSCQ